MQNTLLWNLPSLEPSLGLSTWILVLALGFGLAAWTGTPADADESVRSDRPRTIEDFMALGERPRVIAHRGFSGNAPENTLVAIEQAIELGADMVEVDIGLTSDGHVVLLHDETLDRTTDGSGLLSDASLETVRRLDAGSWFDAKYEGEPVPTLGEALDLVRGRILINLEIKSEAVGEQAEGGIADKVLHAVRERRMLNQIVISSFEPRALEHARQLEATVRTASLYNRDLHSGQGPLEVMDAVDANGFNLSRREVTAEIVEQCHGTGRPVAVYTVNKERVMRRMIDLGVDALFTDYPDRMLALLQEGS